MKNGKDIKAKFANYSADVDDETIHRGWEDIKPFVPKKKKRRVLFYLPVYGFYLFTGLLILGVGLWMTFYFFAPQAQVAGAVETGDMVLAPAKTRVSPTNNRKDPVLNANRNQADDAVYSKDTRLKPNTSAKRSLTAKAEENTPATNGNLPAAKKEKPFLSTEPRLVQNNIVTSKIEGSANTAFEPDSQVAETMELLPFLYRTSSVLDADSLEMNPDDRRMTLRRKNSFRVEVFSSLHFLRNQISHLTETTEGTQLGYSMGFGINYHLPNNVNVVGQFMLHKSDLSDDQTVIGSKTIDTDPSLASDTIKYFATNTTYQLKSRYSYYFGLGLEYELFSKRRVFISGSGLLMMKITNYNYSITRAYGKDTLIYVAPTVFSGLPNSVPSDYTEGIQKQTIRDRTIGFTPGLKLLYRLHEKWAVFVRPCLTFELSHKNFGNTTTDFKVQQKDVFIQFGIQFWNLR